MARTLLDPSFLAPSPPAERAAGFTVWRLVPGHGRGRPAARWRWFLAHSGPEQERARAIFDRLASLGRGAVQLRDPHGREIAFHVGRWVG